MSISGFDPNDKCSSDIVKVCTSYLLEGAELHPTVVKVATTHWESFGYIPTWHLRQIVAANTRLSGYLELDNSVLFFIWKLTKEELCFEFGFYTEISPFNVQSGSISISDYYDKDVVFLREVIKFMSKTSNVFAVALYLVHKFMHLYMSKYKFSFVSRFNKYDVG